MQLEEIRWTEPRDWKRDSYDTPLNSADLVLYFGSRAALASGARFQDIAARYPGAILLGCSTGGQILEEMVEDDLVVSCAVKFDRATLRVASTEIGGLAESRDRGRILGERLIGEGLKAAFLLSDGLHVNGGELVKGIAEAIGPDVVITGGLAGDGAGFQETLVGCMSAPAPKTIGIVGFYGDQVRISHGSVGGWAIFGPRRRITRSAGRTLYELDGKPALELYKRYLGEEASKLPASGLYFPMKIWPADRPEHDVVRTILAIDEAAGSMTFAGDMPEGHIAQLMRGNLENLTAGAGEAASQAAQHEPGLSILISCIGRRLLMGQRVSDEIEAAGRVLGPTKRKIGFYSYGEIAPHAVSGICELHNQTMTITTITEAAPHA